jgi:hypothetical protein
MNHLVQYEDEKGQRQQAMFTSTYADPDTVAEEFVHAHRGTRVLGVTHQPIPGTPGTTGAPAKDSPTGVAGTGNKAAAGERLDSPTRGAASTDTNVVERNSSLPSGRQDKR